MPVRIRVLESQQIVRVDAYIVSRVTLSDSGDTVEAPLSVVADLKNMLHYVQLDRKIIRSVSRSDHS